MRFFIQILFLIFVHIQFIIAITTSELAHLQNLLDAKNDKEAVDYVSGLPGDSLYREPGYQLIRDTCNDQTTFSDFCVLRLRYAVRNELHEHDDSRFRVRRYINHTTFDKLRWMGSINLANAPYIVKFFNDNYNLLDFYIDELVGYLFLRDYDNFDKTINYLELIEDKGLEAKGYTKFLKEMSFLNEPRRHRVIVIALRVMELFQYCDKNECSNKCIKEIQDAIKEMPENLQKIIQNPVLFRHTSTARFMHMTDYLQIQRIETVKRDDFNPSNDDSAVVIDSSQFVLIPHNHKEKTLRIRNYYYAGYFLRKDPNYNYIYGVIPKTDIDIDKYIFELQPIDEKFEQFLLKHRESNQYVYANSQTTDWAITGRDTVITQTAKINNVHSTWYVSSWSSDYTKSSSPWSLAN